MRHLSQRQSLVCGEAGAALAPVDLVWVNDYHLIPLAEALRTIGMKQRVGFFLHTPFPAPQVLTALPNHVSLMRALMAYDVIGLQTAVDLRAFRDYMRFEAGGAIEPDGRVTAFGRTALGRRVSDRGRHRAISPQWPGAANSNRIERLAGACAGAN